MGEITTVGLDLAKQVFQVHAVDAAGEVVLRKALRRGQVTTFFAGLPRCLIGMEACATAHHWARELTALGHEVRLMPPQYVKAYVRRQKNDAADAAAICEAVTRPAMRFVPVKSEAQQAALILHRVRDLLLRQRTMLINALRGHLAEFGVVAPQGPRQVAQLAAVGPRRGRGPRARAGAPGPAGAGRAARGARRAAWRRSAGELLGLASRQSDQPAAGDHPRHRAGDRQHPGGDGRRSGRLPQRARVRGLARPGAAAELERRARRGWAGSASAATGDLRAAR